MPVAGAEALLGSTGQHTRTEEDKDRFGQGLNGSILLQDTAAHSPGRPYTSSSVLLLALLAWMCSARCSQRASKVSVVARKSLHPCASPCASPRNLQQLPEASAQPKNTAPRLGCKGRASSSNRCCFFSARTTGALYPAAQLALSSGASHR